MDITSFPIFEQFQNIPKRKDFARSEGVTAELYLPNQYSSTLFEKFTAKEQRKVSVHQTPGVNEHLSEQWSTSIPVPAVEEKVVYPVIEGSSVPLQNLGKDTQDRISHTERHQPYPDFSEDELCIPRNDSEAINLVLDMQMELPSNDIETIALPQSEDIQLEQNIVQQHSCGLQNKGTLRGGHPEKNTANYERDPNLESSEAISRRRRKLLIFISNYIFVILI